MSELNDSSELQKYSSAVLYVLSAVDSPPDYVHVIANHFLTAIKSSNVSEYFACLSFVNGFSRNTVVARTLKCATHSTGFLLQKPHVHRRRRRYKDDGRPPGLSL